MTPLLTIPEVADILKISPRTCWKKVKAGIIPGFLLGSDWRIHPEQLDQYLRRAAGLPVEEQPRRGRKKTDYQKKLAAQYPNTFGAEVIH